MRRLGKDDWGWRSVALCSVLLLLGAGCASTPENSAEWPAPEKPVLVLQVGDEVEVLFPYWKDLESRQSIRLDGKITLQLVGEVEAAGRTPLALEEHLEELYKDRLKDPEITVVASTLGNQRIFVGGEVMQPGVLMMPGKLTVLQAVMQAGGPNKESAKLSEVVVIRQRDGKQYTRLVNLRDTLEKGEGEPLELAPFDVVVVPRTAIDQVNQWVEQYVNRIVPRNFYANYSWNDTRDGLSGDSTNTSFTYTAPGI